MIVKRICLIVGAAIAMIAVPTAMFLFVMLKSADPVEVDTRFANQESLSFLILGDQGTGNLRQWQVARGMETAASRQPVNGVLLMGDSFYRHGVESVTDLQWRYKLENVYEASLASTPFFATFGNHDYYGSETILIEYDLQNRGSGRWQLPARDYLKIFGDAGEQPLVRMVFIDTGLFLRSVEDAVTTFDRLLATAPPATWTIVVTHKPFISGNQLDHPEGASARWQPALKKHGVDLVLSGHDHNMQLLQRPDWPTQVIQGAGGKYGQPLDETGVRDGLGFYSADLGFGQLEVTQETLEISFLNTEAETLHSDKMTK